MAKYGSDDVTIEIDTTAGGSLSAISQYVQELPSIDVEAMLEEGHAAGDSWVEQLFTGVKRIGDITLGGFYDDTSSTGPDAILNDVGSVRTLAVTYGSTKKTTVEVLIKSYKRTLSRGALHRFQAVLSPTGAPTEA